MGTVQWTVFAVLVLLLAYLSASYHYREGLPFWRTFVMAIIGFSALGLFLLKIYYAA